jgi:sulfur carrier protein ThiS adenylyltransferase
VDGVPDLRAELATKRVGIIGLGGLGSNAAVMLLRCGVRRMVLADFDRVEESNLNRQSFFRDQIGALKTEALAETMLRIDPGAELTFIAERVDPAMLLERFGDLDLIIEAVDRPDVKAMIMNTCMQQIPDVPLVTASGLAGYGSANAIETERFCENLWVVGDLSSDVDTGLPLFASRVMVAAAHEAHMAIRVLLGYPEP